MSQSPWLAPFQQTAKAWEKQTGNKIEYRIFTFSGLLEKTLSAAQAKSQEFDLIQLHEIWCARFYGGGFVVPLNSIDPGYKWPASLITYNNTGRWDAKAKWFSPNGEIMALPINGNLQLFYYRGDRYQEKGLKPPETWDDVVASARLLTDKSKGFYGYCNRGQKGFAALSWDFSAFLYGYGGSWFAHLPVDWTPAIDTDKALEALETYLSLTQFAPPNVGNIGQPEQFALLQSGKLLQTIVVAGGAFDMDDPNKSTVVDKIQYAVVPKPAHGTHVSMLGIWLMGIPVSVPKTQQQIAFDFLKWFTSQDAQMQGARLGGIPVRQDIYGSNLRDQKKFRYLKAMGASTPYLGQYLDFDFAPEIIDVLELRLNQTIIGETKPKQALQTMQSEVAKIVKAHGH
jgi:multiple sugar transport system substrate-binding protein